MLSPVAEVTAKNDRSSTCESSDEGDEKDNTRKTLSTKRTKADREEERRRKENQMQDQEKKRIRQALGQHVAEEVCANLVWETKWPYLKRKMMFSE